MVLDYFLLNMTGIYWHVMSYVHIFESCSLCKIRTQDIICHRKLQPLLVAVFKQKQNHAITDNQIGNIIKANRQRLLSCVCPLVLSDF